MGEDYLALTHDERGDSGVNYYNNDMAAKMMQTGGFVGTSPQSIKSLTSLMSFIYMIEVTGARDNRDEPLQPGDYMRNSHCDL